MSKNSGYKYLYLLLSIFIGLNTLSVFASTKIVDIFGLEVQGGALVIPFAIITVGLIEEVYGRTFASKSSWLNLLAVWIVILGLQFFIGALPDSKEWRNNEAYDTIFNSSFRIAFAGLITFLIVVYSRIFTMEFLKKIKIRSFAIRNYIGAFASQSLNAAVFPVIAFTNIKSIEFLQTDYSWSLIWKFIWQVFIILMIVEIVAGFVLPSIARYLKKKEGLINN